MPHGSWHLGDDSTVVISELIWGMDSSQMFFLVVTGACSPDKQESSHSCSYYEAKEPSSNTHSNKMIFRTANLTHYNLILWQFQNLTCDVSTIGKHSSDSSTVYIASSSHWLLRKAFTAFKFPRAPCLSGEAGRGVTEVDMMFHNQAAKLASWPLSGSVFRYYILNQRKIYFYSQFFNRRNVPATYKTLFIMYYSDKMIKMDTEFILEQQECYR